MTELIACPALTNAICPDHDHVEDHHKAISISAAR
jgi:hypothetical protein